MTAYTAFDPLKNTGILSNGNLTVAQNGNDTGAAGLFRDAKLDGKHYYEMHLDAIGGSDNAVGFGPAGITSVAQIASGPRNGVMMYTSNGNLYSNATNHGPIGPATPAAGDVIGIAVDLDHGKAWMKNLTQSGDWNNNGSANPATNTGGYDIPTGLFSWTPYATFSSSAAQTTANFGATAFVGSVPSGFASGWIAFAANIYPEYSNQFGSNNTATSGTINVSTGGSNRVIVLEITITETTAAAVTSITDAAGLTWHGLLRNVVNDGTRFSILDVWWAEAPTQLTNNTITINCDSAKTQAFNVISVFGAANPVSPWDPSGPTASANISPSVGSVPTVSGFNTTNGNALVMEFINTAQPTDPQIGPGYLLAGSSDQEPNAGGNRSYETLGYQVFGAPLSSVTIVGGNSLAPWGIAVAAIDGRIGAFGDWISSEAPDTMAGVGYVGAFGVIGSLLTTEAKDIATIIGVGPIVGSFVVVEARDHFSAFGFQPLTGTLVATGAPDVMHATGIGLGEDGILITTEAVDIFAAVGNTPIVGSFDTTETPDRFLALGAGVIRVRRRRTIFVT